ncbi:FAD-dependent oxidoreductase [Bailinhaonella thermotolerans]|uniref:3-oxosteroid 1-dehydrogenase n=1 Tax=Bailinhaonella thermotolerans TaxID=1070861 RepID=A0A3A4A4W4_9ACTN|nr:FAD-dependent oxidoreductase [Bailinhaonella thermotolerans]RJL22819.1 FAD-dependent oxidoreductase [Bailinhaonella thermotolerans]
MGWDSSYDVVVVGSGAAGMAAAITARHRGLSALVLEKTGKYGGSTALSGGAIWVPGNLCLPPDSREEARRYLDATVGDRVPAARKDAYLDQGPEMVRFMHEKTRHVRFEYTPGYSDYYPERPGGRPEGRSAEPVVFDGKRLGPEFARMRRAGLPTYGLTINSYEFHKLNMITRTWIGKRTSLKVGLRAVRALLTGARYLSLGEALIARMRLSLAEAGAELRLNAPLEELVIEDGRVTGVVAAGERIRARHGVILAAGGFSSSQEMRERYLPKPTDKRWSSAAEGQTGDVIEAGLKAGAALDLMDRVWGAPSVVPPGERPFFLVADRGIPGMMIVNERGERFVNEAVPYHEFVDTMYATGTPKAWMILDARAKSRYLFLGLFPGQPFPKRWRTFVKRARTVEELAALIGVPAGNLKAQFERFNAFARRGVDEEFGRGDSAYDRYYGDPTLPNPNLLPMVKAPFYAVPVVPGDIGTKGGLVTDEHARVLREDGSAIEGLYAAGNCSAAVMGETYPGPGATIGPAMTFGYVAANHIADNRGADSRGADSRAANDPA